MAGEENYNIHMINTVERTIERPGALDFIAQSW